MTEEEKQQLIAEGKLDAEGNPIEQTPPNHGGEPGKPPNGEEPKKIELTQAQLDAMIEGRLARDRKAREDAELAAKAEEDRKRLEDNQEYKSLADQYKEELEQLKEDARKAEIASKRTSLLLKAGYNEDQIERYGKYVEGETEDEMKAAVELLKQDVPPTPKYVDPQGAGNSQRQQPKPTDKEDKGRSIYQRLKQQGKMRP